MRAQSRRDSNVRFYRCRAAELGYTCEQNGVYAEVLDQQVIDILLNLKPPSLWRDSITQSIGELLGQKDLDQRLAEIPEVIKRMDHHRRVRLHSAAHEASARVGTLDPCR